MDIYFEEKYGKLNEKIEQGKSVCLDFSCEYGKIRYVFIKRRISTSGPDELYDIITPYGYGGPILLETTDRHKLLSLFADYMEKYYIENNIVSEFVRFHPIAQNAKDFDGFYKVEQIRKTLVTYLSDKENPVEVQFTKGCRKKIRQSLNKGVTYEVEESPKTLDGFKQIYYSTMDRNLASEYYYFDDEYFDYILSEMAEQILLIKALYEDKVIAAMLCFISDETIHIHLSGTLNEYLYLSPAYILRYAATVWAHEHGMRRIHHGGGRTNAEDDSLFNYKKQFTNDSGLDFCIAKKICNDEAYQRLCEMNKGIENKDFFPAYRTR